MIVSRNIEKVIQESIGSFKGITISGPRQSGKTTLVKRLFPDAAYYSLENPDIRRTALEDPRGFLNRDGSLTILDEIQNTPDLLSYIQEIMDSTDRKFVLTGSNRFTLLESVNQSLAGRVATFILLPFSLGELQRMDVKNDINYLIYSGFYPSIYDQKRNPTIAYRSYYETYIERDVRKLINVKDINNYQKFMRLCAGRIGQVLNANSLSNELGVSSHTVKSWLSTLEASYVIFLLQPYHKNINKRLIKSPKLYFYDVGLASYLLGLETHQQISRDPLYGSLFENLCISEMLKIRMNKGLDSDLFYYRDSNMNEIDVVQKTGSGYHLIEIKSASTFHPGFTKSMHYFEKSIENSISGKTCIYQGESLPPVHQTEILNVFDFFLR
jgi:predicted AAA+ superfamily ATPase